MIIRIACFKVFFCYGAHDHPPETQTCNVYRVYLQFVARVYNTVRARYF